MRCNKDIKEENGTHENEWDKIFDGPTLPVK